jgi:WD40 repeat protein
LPEWKGSIQHAPFLKYAADGTLYSVRDKQLLEVPSGGKFRLVGDKLDVGAPEEMVFDPTGKRLILINNILGRPAGEIRVYDATKGSDPEKVATTDHVRAVALSRDGKTLAMSYLPSGGKGHLELWDTAGWKLRTTAPGDTRKNFMHYRALAFAPDGKTLVGVPQFEKVGNTVILDILDADGKVVREVKMQSLRVISMTFSPDGKTLAAILSNHAVALFDPTTGEEKKP